MPTLTYDSALDYDDDVAYDASSVGTPVVHGSVVELAGIVFDGAVGPGGVAWFLTDLAGWDSPEVRSGSTARPQDDGLWLPEFWYGGRVLELKGWALCESAQDAFEAKNTLAAAMNLLRSDATLVVTEDRARQAVVRRNDRLLMNQVGDTLEFSIPLLAKDPRKYATEETVAAAAAGELATFTNDGTVATIPTAVITGPIETPVLVNVTTGEELGFDITLDEGDELALDFDLRTARSAGVSWRSSLLPGYSWWRLAPHGTVIRLDADDSDVGAGVTVTARSAWI